MRFFVTVSWAVLVVLTVAIWALVIMNGDTRQRLALLEDRERRILSLLNHEAPNPQVGGSDVAVDSASGRCYRLVWVFGTDHYPAALVTTDGVTCPYGIGRGAPGFVPGDGAEDLPEPR